MHSSAHDDREILITGFGSAGRRHAANLEILGWRRLRVYRTGRSTLPDAAACPYPVEHDLEAALARRPLAVVVSNPSALHLPVARAAACADAHLLIEKPVSSDLEGLADLERDVGARGLRVLVGFQFRFHPALQQVKAWLDAGAIGGIVSVQVHWGEYLPDMHPWEDHHVGYAARADLGGGVLLTFCHPFDYLRWLVGEISDVSAIDTAGNALGVNVDTAVDVTVRFTGGATGHVHLNFVQRPADHRLLIVGTEGTVTWSHDDQVARRYDAASRRWDIAAVPNGFTRNAMFQAEMQHFLACLSGAARPVCTLHDGRRALEIVLAAKHAMAGRPA